ncbi:GM18654 [Drosophila sechellia]|uniref:GM18654 n=2 Tax=Drosophila sechellia TaxID=7238 RepID=B4I1Z7_DROSE|nr:GM18654 [Drosophila sechellia]
MQHMSLRHSSGSAILAQLAVGEVKAQDSVQNDTGGDGVDVGQQLDDDIGNTTCPWVKMKHPLWQQKLKEPMSLEQPNKKEPSEVKSQIYIPPALRQSQGDFNHRDQAESRLRKVPSKMSGKPQAPDLNSDEYFPSLSKTPKRTK